MARFGRRSGTAVADGTGGHGLSAIEPAYDSTPGWTRRQGIPHAADGSLFLWPLSGPGVGFGVPSFPCGLASRNRPRGTPTTHILTEATLAIEPAGATRRIGPGPRCCLLTGVIIGAYTLWDGRAIQRMRVPPLLYYRTTAAGRRASRPELHSNATRRTRRRARSPSPTPSDPRRGDAHRRRTRDPRSWRAGGP